MVKVTIKIDTSKYNISPEQVDEIKTHILNMTQAELIRNLRIKSPVDTGRLQGSWMTGDDGEEREVYTSTQYADFLDKGTGIYGPRGKLITPQKKNGVLVFTPRTGEFKGKTVFAKSVRGIKPRHFVEDSIKETGKRIEEFAIRAINKA